MIFVANSFWNKREYIVEFHSEDLCLHLTIRDQDGSFTYYKGRYPISDYICNGFYPIIPTSLNLATKEFAYKINNLKVFL